MSFGKYSTKLQFYDHYGCSVTMNFYVFLCLEGTAVLLGNSRSGTASASPAGGADPKGISVADPCFILGKSPLKPAKF